VGFRIRIPKTINGIERKGDEHQVIEALRNDGIIDKVGGRFKLTALIQRRWLQLLQGGRPMVDPKGLTEMEVVLQEIEEGKIDFELYEGEEEEES
jgi:DNA-directed RNA polymerase subunit omega